MIAVFIFILGLLIGSFLNVCIYRIPRGESIAFPPSHCTACGTSIMWYDLIPVISYIILSGRCRKCGDRISIIYPVLEIATGLLFTGLYLRYGLTFELVKFAVLTAFLIVIGMIDLRTTDVYLKTTLSGIIAGIIFLFVGKYLGSSIMNYIFGALLGGGVISLIILLTGEMGWGDAEICLLIGIYLGFKYTMLTLFLSFVLGGTIGAILILLKKKTRRDYIPFGPFLSLAAIITLFFGKGMLNWYISLL